MKPEVTLIGRWRSYLKDIARQPIWRPVVHSSSWIFSAALVSRASGLVGLVIVTRLLSASAFGILALAQLFMGVVSVVAGLGIRLAATKRIAETQTTQPSLAESYVSQALRTNCILGVVVGLGLSLARVEVATNLLRDPASASLVVALAMMLPFSVVSDSLIGILSGLEQFGRVARLAMIRSTLLSLAMVLGVAAIGGIRGAIAGWVFAEVISCLVGLNIAVRALRAAGLRLRLGSRARDWRWVLAIGLPAAAASLAIQGSVFFGQQLLAAPLGGLEHVAVFSVAFRWSTSILLPLSAVSPIFLPMLSGLRAEGKHEEFRRLLRGNVAVTIAMSVLPAAAIGALAPWLMGLSGAMYRQQSVVLVILAIAALPTALNTLLSQVALATDAIRAWLFSDLALALTLVACALLLTARLHAAGLAVSYLSAYCATCLVLWRPVRARIASGSEPRSPETPTEMKTVP